MIQITVVSRRPLLQPRQLIHNPHRFHAHPDDALDEVDDVARVFGPVVRVILDAAGLVHRDGVALHDPELVAPTSPA